MISITIIEITHDIQITGSLAMLSRMKCIAPVLLVVFLTIAPFGFADVQDEPDQVTSFSGEIEVILVEIDVRVRDRDGRPVSGLGIEEFEVLENGQSVPIASFFEVRPNEQDALASAIPTAPVVVAGPATSRLVVVVDDDSIHPVRRNRSLDDLTQFISEELPQDTIVTVIRLARGVDVVVDGSADLATIKRALDELRQRSGGSPLAEADYRSVVRDIRDAERFREAVSYARRYAGERRQVAQATLSALDSVVASLAGVGQRTVLLYVGEGFPVEPGIEAFRLVQELYPEDQVMVETAQYVLHDRLAALIDHANSAGVTISTYDARGLDMGMSAGADGDVASSTLDGLALDSALRQSRQASLRGLSFRTGGEFSASNNLDRLLDTTRDDLTAFYSIGFHSSSSGESARRIEVLLDRPGTGVRFRSSFSERSTAQRRVDQTLAAVYMPPRDNDFLISVVPGEAKPLRKSRYLLPVDVIIPVDALTAVPTVDGFGAQAELLFVSADVKGAVSEVHRVELTPEIPSEIKGDRIPVIRYSATLKLTKGQHRIAVTVSDLVGGGSSSLAGQVVVP